MTDPVQSRRPVLQHINAREATNAGLWLDKFIDQNVTDEQRKDYKPEKKLVDEVAGVSISEEYKQFYMRWKKLLETKCLIPPKEAKVQGRLAIGLGMESVLETSISLHRTYGVPYIPGSALKGLAAHYARNFLTDEWAEGTEAYITLFGDTDSAGYITFYDALYVPASDSKDKALWPDIITVHHPDYYQGKDSPPADWDNPTPIPFLSATGKYLIALGGPEAWAEKAFEILELALAKLGVGAKTSSGYGRLLLGKAIEKAEEAKETYALAKLRLLKEETPPPGRLRGTVVKTERGGDYGWINPAKGGGAQIFVHHNQLREDGQRLVEDQVVEYREGTYQGKIQAQDVIVLLGFA